MFRLYLTLAYIIPNIYVFTRINQLFISKGFKIRYSIIYLLLFLIYPITGNYRGHNPNLVMNILSVFSGYLLPFYLYLFLTVLLFDVFLLLNLIFKILSTEKRKSFRCRFCTFSAMILISVFVVIGGAINLNTIQVSEYHVNLPKRNSDIDSLRVAFVSDIHIQQSTRIHYIEKLVGKINKLHPDIMLFGGDIVEGDGENETSEAIEAAFRNIQTKYGSFGVVGNHEFYGGQQNGEFFRKAGITMLVTNQFAN